MKKSIFCNHTQVDNLANSELPFIKNNPIFAEHCFTQGNKDLGILSKEGYLDTTQHRLEASGLLDEIQATDNVLDLGSAEGQMDWVLKDKCNSILSIERDLHCYLVSEEFKRIFKYPNINYINDDILNLDSILPIDQRFERILFFNVVIMNQENRPGFIRTAKNLNTNDYYTVLDSALNHLAPNGTLYMSNQYLRTLAPLLEIRYKDRYSLDLYWANKRYPNRNYTNINGRDTLYYLKIINNKKDRD